jgi:cyclic pyranopterin phosphate synthase
MPSWSDFKVGEYLLNAGEIETLASAFVDMGVTKIRLTGGEPLMRKDFSGIAERISKLNTSLHITTNGFYIDRYIDLLAARFNSINISLDTLKPERFTAITRRGYFSRVMNNLALVLEKNMETKLNVVVIKHTNHDEIKDFVRLTLHHPVEVRFIEFMPFRGNQWNESRTYTAQEMLRDIKQDYDVGKLGISSHDTAEKYRVNGAKGSFGFISTVSHPFCSRCNRIRITADGKLRLCLFGDKEYDLKPFLRNLNELQNFITDVFALKNYKHGGITSIADSCAENMHSNDRCMTAIGG